MTVCGAKTRQGTPCQRPSGWGTNHVGSGRCKLHGGNAGRPIVTGRYSLEHRRKLAEKQNTFLSDSKPWDLSDELALMRALLQEYLDRYPDGEKLPVVEVDRIFGMIEKISQLVERITKILNSTALTQVEIQYLQARLADLLNKYVTDPDDRKRFLAELAEPIDVRHRDRSETKRIIEVEST